MLHRTGPYLHFETVAAAFVVRDIAQALVTSAPPDWHVEDVVDAIFEDGIEHPDNFFCLVRSEGRILGYIALDFIVDTPEEENDGPADGLVGEHCWRISPDQIVSSELPLIELLPLFAKHYFFFVLRANDLSHTVSFNDIDKLPVKLCLFTLIMGLEAELLRVYSRDYVRIEKYLKLLPKGRLQLATELAKRKALRPASGTAQASDAPPMPHQVLTATTFIDKFSIWLRSLDLVAKLPFASKRQAEAYFNRLQELRNAIAHSDSIRALFKTPDELADFLTKLRELMTTVEVLASETE